MRPAVKIDGGKIVNVYIYNRGSMIGQCIGVVFAATLILLVIVRYSLQGHEVFVVGVAAGWLLSTAGLIVGTEIGDYLQRRKWHKNRED
jgi:hypothetical protein